MKKSVKISKSPTETEKIGRSLGKSLKGGDTIALFGDLGAGKTVFVKGIARGLGIKKRILSPTFIFMRSYPLKSGQFIHIDLYRGKVASDFEALGLEEIFTSDNIVVLEWAEKIKDFLPKKRIDVTVEKVDEKTRRIIISR